MAPQFYTVRGYQLLEQKKKSLTASLEDYLEMICRSIRHSGGVRVKDLADALHVKPSSASKMIQKLADLGLLDYEKYGVIRLTEEGKAVGDYLLWRHDTITNFFTLIASGHNDILVETELAEHILSRETVEHIACLVDFFRERPNLYLEFKSFASQ